MTRRRGWWRGIALGGATVGSLLLNCGSPPTGDERFSATPPAAIVATVVEVIDGDTIVIVLPDGRTENVRYIGIDTPESTPDQPRECFGRRAAAANRALVGGHQVELSFGPERRDDYGRLLAYVQADGLSVNAALVRRGFARTLTIAPNDARAPQLARLEAAAGRAGRGLWSACNT